MNNSRRSYLKFANINEVGLSAWFTIPSQVFSIGISFFLVLGINGCDPKKLPDEDSRDPGARLTKSDHVEPAALAPSELELIASVRRGDALDVAYLLERGANVNARDLQGNTALMWAIMKGHDEVVRVLIGHRDIELEDRDELGNTALMWAASVGNLPIAGELIEQEGVEVNSQNYDHQTPLMLAVLNSRQEMVDYLLGRRGDWQSTVSEEEAKDWGFWAKWSLGQREPTEVNARDFRGRTALILAAELADPRIVELLLAHPDTRVEVADHQGRTALIAAAGGAKENLEVVELLLKYNQGESERVSPSEDEIWRALLAASDLGYNRVVTRLLSHEGSSGIAEEQRAKLIVRALSRAGSLGQRRSRNPLPTTQLSRLDAQAKNSHCEILLR